MHTPRLEHGRQQMAMKAAPLGLYMALTNPACAEPQWSQDIDKLRSWRR
jgi:hypothetical protein